MIIIAADNMVGDVSIQIPQEGFDVSRHGGVGVGAIEDENLCSLDMEIL